MRKTRKHEEDNQGRDGEEEKKRTKERMKEQEEEMEGRNIEEMKERRM